MFYGLSYHKSAVVQLYRFNSCWTNSEFFSWVACFTDIFLHNCFCTKKLHWQIHNNNYFPLDLWKLQPRPQSLLSVQNGCTKKTLANGRSQDFDCFKMVAGSRLANFVVMWSAVRQGLLHAHPSSWKQRWPWGWGCGNYTNLIKECKIYGVCKLIHFHKLTRHYSVPLSSWYNITMKVSLCVVLCNTYMNSSWSVSASLNSSCVGALPVIPCHPSSLQVTTLSQWVSLLKVKPRINLVDYQLEVDKGKLTTIVNSESWHFKC